MSNRAKTEVGITGLGITLGTLGVLLPHCWPLAVLGVIVSAIGFGMLIAGALGESGGPTAGPTSSSRWLTGAGVPTAACVGRRARSL